MTPTPEQKALGLEELAARKKYARDAERIKYARDPDYGRPPQWRKLYAKHCPRNTDPWSRHARLIAEEILRDPRSPVRRLLIDAGYEPDHWASAIEVTVKNLWEAREHLEYVGLPKRNGKFRGKWIPRTKKDHPHE